MTKSDTKTVNSRAIVERTIKLEGGRTEDAQDEEVVSIHRFHTEPAVLEFTEALTMNLGNFESARFSVSLRMPCYREEIDEAYEFAQTWVEARMKKERDLIRRKTNGDENPL